MPRGRPPPVRHPCERCKAKHVRCDDGSGSCRRCLAKDVHCVRLPKAVLFLPGSSARHDSRFTGDEVWVSGTGRRCQVSTTEDGSVQPNGCADLSQPASGTSQVPHTDTETPSANSCQDLTCSPITFQHDEAVHDALHAPIDIPTHISLIGEEQETGQSESPRIQTNRPEEVSGLPCASSLDTVQACLLRYFVDHLSSWFDTCDEKHHFQLFVPVWARHYPPLLNAICATSLRHLSRMSKYTTAQGIRYEGQDLTGLTAHTAVEYMLACIPVLRQFHNIQAKTQRKLVVATAIVLRQFEEMEDDPIDSSQITSKELVDGGHHETQVNFLDIINTIVRASYDEGKVDHHDLLDVAYWICLRQEVYSAFTQKRTPQMLLAPEHWIDAATVDKTVMHAAQVAKWLFEDRSVDEWNRLNEQQTILELNISCQTQYAPILRRPSNKANGEVFPTIWYGSDLVVIGVQHVLIAKMVLISEEPGLVVSHDRQAHRKAEAKVRDIVLELCGVATHRLSCPPALVNAIMGILLYGDFFTDKWERQALASLIKEFRSVKAWPLPEDLRSFV